MSNLLSRLFSKKAKTPEETLGQKLINAVCADAPDPQKITDLIAAGAPVDYRDKISFTALHYACRDRKPGLDTVQILLKAGADINAKTFAIHDVVPEMTPLFLAAYNNKKDVVEWLIAKNAPLDEKTKDGKTALYWARRRGHDDIAEMLEKAAEDAKMRDLKQKQAQRKQTGLRL